MTDKVPFFWALNRSRVCCTILMIQQFFAPIKSKCSATFDVIVIDTFLNKWTSFILKLHRVNPREIPENKESEEFRMGWLLWNIIQRLIVIITSGGLISIDLCREIASLCSTSFGHTSTWNNLQSSELHYTCHDVDVIACHFLQKCLRISIGGRHLGWINQGIPKERTRNFAIRILGPTFDERHTQNY